MAFSPCFYLIFAFFALLAPLCTPASAYADEEEAPPTVLTIGDRHYNAPQLNLELRSDPQFADKGPWGAMQQGDKARFIERLRTHIGLLEEAQDEISNDDPALRWRLARIAEDLRIERYKEQWLSEQLTEDALIEHYAQLLPTLPERYRYTVRQFLTAHHDTAGKIADALKSGMHVSEVQRRFAFNVSTSQMKDWTPESLPQPVQSAFERASPGDTIGPFETGFGWHVILVQHRQTLDKPSFDAMKPEVRKALAEKLWTAHIAALRDDTDVESHEAPLPWNDREGR